MTTPSILVCATRVHVRSVTVLPVFVWHTTRIHEQARAAEGNLMTRARSTGLLTFWTMTAWRDTAALHRYLVSGAHGRVMARAKRWFDEASVARWLSDSPHADWSEVKERLATLGRLVPVDAPSPAQLAANPLGRSGNPPRTRRRSHR